MKIIWRLVGCGLLAVVCSPFAVSKPVMVSVDGVSYTVSGPYRQSNLSVFLLHTRSQYKQQFLTLTEGLKSGLVKVMEKGNGEVNELLITNKSAKPLFLQEGERVVGGKQDRILSNSLVVPPKSAMVPIPAFCVEKGRWTEGKVFAAPASPSLAPKSVREAAKIGQSQSEVWDRVAKEKSTARTQLKAPSLTTSLSETLDSKPVMRAADRYVKTLGSLCSSHPDATGAVFAVNGSIEEVNIYPNHRLLDRMYLRLLRSYALDAASHPAAVTKNLEASDVARFMAWNGTVQKSYRRINTSNAMYIFTDGSANRMDTNYKGAPVHQQFMRRSPDSAVQQAPTRRR